MVTKVVVGLISKATAIGDFYGFQVLEGKPIEVLRFADDTFLLYECDLKKLWSIKAILKGFELVSGLGINFHKSKIHGLNLNQRFVLAAANFLACKIEGNNFNFLGIPIGSNLEESVRANLWWRILRGGFQIGNPTFFLKEGDLP